MAARKPRRPLRYLEVLPVDLLRDAGAGASPVQCDISLGGRSSHSCEIGGNNAAARRRAADGAELWPGSVLIELADDELLGGGGGGATAAAAEADNLTVGVRYDRAGETVEVGSLSLSLADAAQKENHKRWLEAPVSASGGRSAKNLLQLRARVHDALEEDGGAEPLPLVPASALRQPKQPAPAHPRPPPPRPATIAAAARAAGVPSPKTLIMVEADAALLAPGTPVTRFRSKFFGQPSATELADSLRSVLGVQASPDDLELVDASSGSLVEPAALENGAAVRLRARRTPPPAAKLSPGKVQFTHEEVLTIDKVDESLAATTARTVKAGETERRVKAEKAAVARRGQEAVKQAGAARGARSALLGVEPEPEPEPELRPEQIQQQAGVQDEEARRAALSRHLRQTSMRAVDVGTSKTDTMKSDLDDVTGVLSENITMAVQRGESLTELELQSEELVRLSARFHSLGRQISEAERKKFAATILQAIVRGFLSRIRNKKGYYSLRLYVKKLAHDPAEMAMMGLDDDGNPVESVHTVWSNQTVQEFLDKECRGLHGPSGACDGRFDVCHSPPSSLHVHLTWDKCRRLSNKRPIWLEKTWDANRVADEESLTIFWHWDF